MGWGVPSRVHTARRLPRETSIEDRHAAPPRRHAAPAARRRARGVLTFVLLGARKTNWQLPIYLLFVCRMPVLG